MAFPQVEAFRGGYNLIRIVGHRGARGVLPENSMIGFDFSLSIGVPLLEFDVVLSAANEYGMLAIMKITGIELMNQGYGVSIDDIVSEHSYTYIATGIVPWRSLGMHSSMQDVFTG